MQESAKIEVSPTVAEERDASLVVEYFCALQDCGLSNRAILEKLSMKKGAAPVVSDVDTRGYLDLMTL